MLLLFCGTAASTGAQTLLLTFTDLSGRPLEKVELRLDTSSERSFKPIYQKSDKKGQVELANLKAGLYEARAQLGGYAPWKRMIDLQQDQNIEQVLLKQNVFEEREKRAAKFLEEREYDRSIEILAELIRHYPEDAVLHDILARAYAGKLDMENAVAVAERAAHLDPRFRGTRNELLRLMLLVSGDQALRRQEFELAVKKFLAVLDVAPDDPKAHEGLALAYGRLGLLDLAIRAVTRAIELAPHSDSLQQLRQMLEANAGAQ